jgi:hypothetical protein
MISLNKSQLDGLAKNLDNLGIASFIALVVGITGHGSTTQLEEIGLLLASINLFVCAIKLRENL